MMLKVTLMAKQHLTIIGIVIGIVIAVGLFFVASAYYPSGTTLTVAAKIL